MVPFLPSSVVALKQESGRGAAYTSVSCSSPTFLLQREPGRRESAAASPTSRRTRRSRELFKGAARLLLAFLGGGGDSPTSRKTGRSRQLFKGVFQPRPGDHEKYGGDPQQPHKLHLVTRVRSGRRRPYWEKEIIKSLGLEKRYELRVHKNIPSVNEKLKVIKHLIRLMHLTGTPAKLNPRQAAAEHDGCLTTKL
uniref:Large ribosomal subunit protein uL30m n=1 Tax=Podarcis muralis TaxID=64176 RepID=A0A670I9L2_PODMU